MHFKVKTRPGSKNMSDGVNRRHSLSECLVLSVILNRTLTSEQSLIRCY